MKGEEGKSRISSTRAASLAMYENLRPFNSGMSPRPKKEFNHSNFLSRDTNRLIDRGLEYFITNDTKDYTSNRMALSQKFGSISVYEVASPIQRLKPACVIQGPKSSCSQDLDIIVKSEGNTRFSYTVNLPEKQKLAFFGFNNGNWQVNINGDDQVSVEWTKDHAFFMLPPGAHKMTFKYEISALKTYWNFFRIGLFMYLIILSFVVFSTFKNRPGAVESR